MISTTFQANRSRFIARTIHAVMIASTARSLQSTYVFQSMSRAHKISNLVGVLLPFVAFVAAIVLG